MNEKEYILLCDESVKDGAFFSNFYGGILVPASKYEFSSRRLNSIKAQQNLFGEVKWTKVSEPYLPKYMAMMDAFFEELRLGCGKVRIMFRQNAQRPRGLTMQQKHDGFYILYYQFIKHAFGFEHSTPNNIGTNLRLYFDQFPDTGAAIQRFRSFILALNDSEIFQDTNVNIRQENFTEVRSHDHIHLQCLDVVLGSMAFRLNDLHTAKVEKTNRRGSRTRAKEKLYAHILNHIRQLRANFNVGITTGGERYERWSHPYRHWAFKAYKSDVDRELTKARQKQKRPEGPT